MPQLVKPGESKLVLHECLFSIPFTINICIYTSLADMTTNSPAEIRNKVFAYFGAVFMASRALVTALTSLTSEIKPWNSTPYAIAMLAASIPIGIVTLFVLIFLKETLPSKPASKPSQEEDSGLQSFIKGVKSIYRDKIMLQVCLSFAETCS